MYECVICHDEEVDEKDRPCMLCYYTGQFFDWALRQDDRANLLDRIEAIPQVKRTAVWHHGNGNFQLTVALEDGRYLFLGAAMKAVEVSIDPDSDEDPKAEVTKFVGPVVPPIGVAWGVAVMAADAASNDDVVLMPDSFETDEELLTALRQMVSLNALMEGD